MFTPRKRGRRPTSYIEVPKGTPKHRRLAYYMGKVGATKRGLAWEMTFQQVEQYRTLPCHYCGSTKMAHYGINLDRIDNDKGYTADNVVTCCTSCNEIKGRNLSYAEMLAVAAVVKALRAQDPPKDPPLPKKPTPKPLSNPPQQPPTVLNEYTKLYNKAKKPKPPTITGSVRG